MKRLALAISIAAKTFEDVLDKGGQPYILHCLEVMRNTIGDECVKCAAVLHDVPEDTNITIGDLTKMGFSDKTTGLLHLLKHHKETPYMEYIKAISVSSEAAEIKRRDLEHNTQITRLKGIGKKDLNRMEKYHQAYLYLKDV